MTCWRLAKKESSSMRLVGRKDFGLALKAGNFHFILKKAILSISRIGRFRLSLTPFPTRCCNRVHPAQFSTQKHQSIIIAEQSLTLSLKERSTFLKKKIFLLNWGSELRR